jgi:hypothetical protein
MAKLDITTLATSRDHAAAWTSTKSAQAKKDIHAQVVAKSKTSKRVRWVNLAKAMAEGDNLRVNAYAAIGEAKSQAWAAVKAANAPASAPAKPKAKAKAKAAPKPKADATPDLNAFAKQLASMDEAAQAAFLNAFARARS